MQKLCVCWTWKKVKAFHLCPTLCDPMDYSVHGILQARILEWVGIPFPRGSSQPRDWTQVSRIAGRLFTSWTTREAHFLKNPIRIFLCSSYGLFLDSSSSGNFLFDGNIIKWYPKLIRFQYYKFIMKAVNITSPILFSFGANTSGLNDTSVHNQMSWFPCWLVFDILFGPRPDCSHF